MPATSRTSPNRIKSSLLNKFYSQFLIGVTEAGAFLSEDPEVERKAREFLARGVQKIFEDDLMASNQEVDRALEKAKELGAICGQEALTDNDGEVSPNVWDYIVSYICPFEPFC
mgnify:CR=1 FL=1